MFVCITYRNKEMNKVYTGIQLEAKFWGHNMISYWLARIEVCLTNSYCYTKTLAVITGGKNFSVDFIE